MTVSVGVIGVYRLPGVCASLRVASRLAPPKPSVEGMDARSRDTSWWRSCPSDSMAKRDSLVGWCSLGWVEDMSVLSWGLASGGLVPSVGAGDGKTATADGLLRDTVVSIATNPGSA